MNHTDALALIPKPEYRPPECPCCWAELEWEDGWTCTDCRIWWDTDLTAANYLDEDTPPCNAKRHPDRTDWTWDDCPLPADHKGDDHYHVARYTGTITPAATP